MVGAPSFGFEEAAPLSFLGKEERA
jgi:hypothetical protein